MLRRGCPILVVALLLPELLVGEQASQRYSSRWGDLSGPAGPRHGQKRPINTNELGASESVSFSRTGPASLGALSNGLRGLLTPAIDRSLTPTNVTEQLGATVYLHCYVRNIGQKTVTWLRRADYHILTVGMVTYTTDERFSAVRGEAPHLHGFMTALAAGDGTNANGAAGGGGGPNSRMIPPAEDWMLQIRGLQKADAGIYECQVNTQHPMLSAHVSLNVLSPRASIAEGSELSVMSGSELSITCVIHDCPQSPLHVFWYHGDRVVNYDNRYSKVNITSLPAAPQHQQAVAQQRDWDNAIDNGRPVSRLTIHNASKQHSGSYVCAPIDSTPATVHVHIFHAEEQMSRQSSSELSDVSASHPLQALYSLGPLLALQMAFLMLVAVRAT